MDLFTFFPLFEGNDEDDIRARMDADLNAGLEPDDENWVDPREGGMNYVISQPWVLEAARIWDALSHEVPAAAFISSSWGEYLDGHAADLGLVRKDAVAATGEVLFTGTPGTVLPSGIAVSADQSDPDIEAPEYITTESGEITTDLGAPTGLTANGLGTGGSLATDDYFYKVTAINDVGETIASSEATDSLTGPTGSVELDWNDVAGATGYKIYRALVTNTEVYLATVTNSNYVDTGSETPGVAEPPAEDTTGGGFLASVECTEPGAAGNVGIGAVVNIDSSLEGLDTVTNPEAITGGDDEEDDEELRERVYLEMQGGGGGNKSDYKRWVLAMDGVGRVTVFPVYNSVPGEVGVSILDAAGDPVSDTIVEFVQNELDPLPGQGEGIAPIGHTVTVFTPTVISVDIVASLSFEAGFSLDGTGGTVALEAALESALSIYIDQLEPGEDVVYNHVLAQFFTVPGLLDVDTLTVEGGSADITIDPDEVAQLATTSLS